MPLQKFVHNEEVWGTVISIILNSSKHSEDELRAGVQEMVQYFHEIDELFSTYKPTSEVSRLRTNHLMIEDAHPWVRNVWRLCEEAKALTLGAFDPWAVSGGFDPSGYVKGWAADRALELIPQIPHVQINAGGDISLRGGNAPGEPWRIGIRHPDDATQIAEVVEIYDGAIATSGTYERGAHIIDPSNGLPALEARSATVVAPDSGVADALATALVVAGRHGAHWFVEHPTWSAWVVDRHGDQTWAIGPHFPKR
ncbi:MAG: FAD:protein FMN transferase [Actinomycetes bacterium]